MFLLVIFYKYNSTNTHQGFVMPYDELQFEILSENWTTDI